MTTTNSSPDPPPFQEVEVDEDLTQFLKQPIPKNNKRTYSEVFTEKVVDEQPEDETINVKPATKEAIYRLWSASGGEQSNELLPLVEKVSKLTEAQAKAYLECLQAFNAQKSHKHLSNRVITFLSHLVCHPKDPLTRLAMEEDVFLVNGIANGISDLLFYLGQISIPILICTYGTFSWYTARQWEREHPNENKTGAPVSSIQNDGVSEVSNGQDIVDDQTHDQGMA